MPTNMSFQAEVKELLRLVTHSLYSNKEIFLRELISNASDAADKLRFEAIAKPELYESDPELKIWIDFDAKLNTITVRDNGIGMNREEVIANLGTIAKSGTREFLASLSGDQAKDANLIGQFGVGFYSAFVVADKVVVRTRRAGIARNAGVLWESSGEGEFTIENIEKPERGTEVVLHLKKDEHEFLDHYRLRGIITKYSDHILLPIVMKQPIAEKETEAKEEIVNKATALWTLPKKDIKEEEYKEFYKHVSHDFEDPLLWSHNRVEGKLEYITLLYIPARAPFDMWIRDQRYGLKLYVQRVFIMDDAEQLLPNYLRFVKGIVDSKDLPLNVSREILQSNKVIEQIKNGVVKRILEMLEKLSVDDVEKYKKFWISFGQVIKEGIVEDFAHREQVAKLLRFASTNQSSSEQTTSLDDYINRMQQHQDKIYYITAPNYNAAKHSPHLEIFKKKGLEVLLLSDRIDEWMMTHFHEYKGKHFQAVSKGDLDLDKFGDKSEKKDEELKHDFEDVIKRMKQVLGDKVKDVRVSNRLTDSPVCIVMSEHDMSLNLQHIMQAAGHAYPQAKPILELNPSHLLVRRMLEIKDENLFQEWSNFFLDQAVVAEGGKLDDPSEFIRRVNKLLQ